MQFTQETLNESPWLRKNLDLRTVALFTFIRAQYI